MVYFYLSHKPDIPLSRRAGAHATHKKYVWLKRLGIGVEVLACIGDGYRDQIVIHSVMWAYLCIPRHTFTFHVVQQWHMLCIPVSELVSFAISTIPIMSLFHLLVYCQIQWSISLLFHSTKSMVVYTHIHVYPTSIYLYGTCAEWHACMQALVMYSAFV